MRFPVVLFDFDGTLVDSAGMIQETYRRVAVHAGIPLPPERLPELYRLGALEAQMTALDPDRGVELTRRYRDVNAGLHATLEPFPGVLPLLGTLRAEGRRLGIVTSK